MLAALSRVSFIVPLTWRSPGDKFQPQTAGGTVRVSDAFVFDDAPRAFDDPRWIQAQATAADEPDSSGPVSLELTIAAAGDTDRLLRIANEINRQSTVPVFFDEGAASFVIHASILYSGYQQHEPDLAFCRREATLNLFIAAFATAQGCLRRLAAQATR
jgi:hypothetical protein